MAGSMRHRPYDTAKSSRIPWALTWRWLVRISKTVFVVVALCSLLFVIREPMSSSIVSMLGGAPEAQGKRMTREEDVQLAQKDVPWLDNGIPQSVQRDAVQPSRITDNKLQFQRNMDSASQILGAYNRAVVDKVNLSVLEDVGSRYDPDISLERLRHMVIVSAQNESMGEYNMPAVSFTGDHSLLGQSIPESYSVKCTELFIGRKSSVAQAINVGQDVEYLLQYTTLTDQMITNMSSNCADFTSRRFYHTKPLSSEEAEFPLAFSMLVYDRSGQVERLLRSIYHPQNFYCIHVDSKSPPSFHLAMTSLSRCFDNVFVSNLSTSVHWGMYSVLQAELICMRELLRRSKTWRYFINLTGHEFPLKTNLDVVRVAKTLGGGNDIYGRMDRKYSHRWQFAYMNGVPIKLKSSPPHNITIYKGSAHIIVSREFVHFILSDPKVRGFLHWVKDTHFPDEIFFSSIQHNPHLGAPGTYSEYAMQQNFHRPQISRYKQWRHTKLPCHGHYLRNICIPGVQDLPRIYNSDKLYLNKLFVDFQPYVYQCLEKLLEERTRQQRRQSHYGQSPWANVNLDYIESLPIAKYHI